MSNSSNLKQKGALSNAPYAISDLSVEAQDLGNARESLSVSVTGDSGDIAFNVKYLMDGLRALPSSDIQMQLNEGNQPVIFPPLSGLKMTYLFMPVQIVRSRN